MWLKWFPWRLVVSRAARARGFIDPVKILSRLESFAQPIEVKEPLELLRSGLVFHARGLLNTGAIQHNLDWIWPYWVERQYNPDDVSFIPRAFSITHVNLTHRNWTAVGIPDFDEMPIVDPRGLLTPFWDSWSLDAWVVAQDGRRLIPSKLGSVNQALETAGGMAVATQCFHDGLELSSRIHVDGEDGIPVCRMDLSAHSDAKAWLVVALRPYNPEGVSFIQDIRLEGEPMSWTVDGLHRVVFEPPIERFLFSNYRSGDVHTRLFETDSRKSVQCDVGMATAAALFTIEEGTTRKVRVTVPLAKPSLTSRSVHPLPDWSDALRGSAPARLPDPLFQALYDGAVRSLVLHSPGDVVYPGPYTYRRFWFRDAAFILHALLCAGLAERAERVLDSFPPRQTRTGFFLSQEGEWDSNGEALWIMKRFCELTGRPPKPEWRESIRRGAIWIGRKRLPDGLDAPHAGLLPPGFSAEHLGPNDYYYWDDFWGIAGLRAAAELLGMLGDTRGAEDFRREADRFLEAVEKSLAHPARRLGRQGMPASPYRRMDAGAIGSLAAGYPLQIFPAEDPRLLDTVNYLMDHCFVRGGFFQDIIHSGINPYLTLHAAQILLRANDLRCLTLFQAVADFASSTGQWPEAIHPRTHGGCMGDGHHVWASAEWVLMLRNSFLREEGDRLILVAGVFPPWLEGTESFSFGPAPTSFGEVSVWVVPKGRQVLVQWKGAWRNTPPLIEVHLPGIEPVSPEPGQDSVLLDWMGLT